MIKLYDTRMIPDEAKHILSFLPRHPDYMLWLDAISAIGNSFDFDVALDILLSHFQDTFPGEHEKKLIYRKRTTGIGTLIYHAKLFGYDGRRGL